LLERGVVEVPCSLELAGKRAVVLVDGHGAKGTILARLLALMAHQAKRGGTVSYPQDHGSLDDTADRHGGFLEDSPNVLGVGYIALQQVYMGPQSSDILDHALRLVVAVATSGQDGNVLGAILGQMHGQTTAKALQPADDEVADVLPQGSP